MTWYSACLEGSIKELEPCIYVLCSWTRRTVVMKEVPRHEYHIDVPLFRDRHHFIEAPPTIVFADGISLSVADMAVSSHKYPDCVTLY